MPYKSQSQVTFFTPQFADPECLTEGGLAWALWRLAEKLFPNWLFGTWAGAGRRGRKAWPARVLVSALVLAATEGVTSRRGMVRRLRRDTSWRAACGLEIGGETPDEATFRRFERYLNRRDRETGVVRIQLLHEHWVRLCCDEGLVGEDAVWAMDSTPAWCFGAVHGTVRLLGDGLRSLGREWSRAARQTLEEVASLWDSPILLAKSSKGHFSINWKDPDQRAKAVDELVRDIFRIIEWVRRNLGTIRRNKRKGLLRRCRNLTKVIANDLEVDEEGRLVVARRVAKDRLVSITDPQARSSRKSKSQSYKGFKIHILGDVISGLIAAISVTAANVGDGHPAQRLIRRAKARHANLREVLGDTAYGGAKLQFVARELLGVQVVSPPPPMNLPNNRFNITDFHVDIERATAICPAGISVPLRVGRKTQFFSWAKADCQNCPFRPQCLSAKTRSKTLIIHPYHEEVAAIRERWQEPETRKKYKLRSQCERLVNVVVKNGCRKAKAWGLRTLQQQTYIAAMANNLALLAKYIAARELATADQQAMAA